MAQSKGGGATPFLAFLVGGLLVVVVVIGLAVFGGAFRPAPRDLDVSLQAPALPRPPALPNPQPMPPPLPQPVPR